MSESSFSTKLENIASGAGRRTRLSVFLSSNRTNICNLSKLRVNDLNFYVPCHKLIFKLYYRIKSNNLNELVQFSQSIL